MPIPNFRLSNAQKIPAIGFGTYKLTGKEGVSVIAEALKSGFRHLDTASFYQNEDIIPLAILDSGVEAKEISITTKIWRTDLGRDAALKSVEKSLKNLQRDTLNFVLIHWPANEHTHDNWEKANRDTWKALESLYEQKVIKSIGLSNFWMKQLTSVLTTAHICPHINQIELHPGFYQRELVAFCKKEQIHVQAWSPLARGRLNENTEIQKIAERHQKTIPQVLLRWLYQIEVSSTPKCSTKERMQENTDIFDFELDAETMNLLNHLPRQGFSGEDPELWRWK